MPYVTLGAAMLVRNIRFARAAVFLALLLLIPFVQWPGSSPTATAADGPTEIEAYYASPGIAGLLGPATGPTTCGLRLDGCQRMYTGGSILWTGSTGAQMSRAGAIRNRWESIGAHNGPAGYPREIETCGQIRNGCYQNFERGSIMWNGALAQPLLPGAIRNHYAWSGYQNGRLGYPVSEERCGLVRDGCYQMFEGGSIVWSAGSGAHTNHYGAIRSRWESLGYENGYLGYPVGEETCQLVRGGCYQPFQGGFILWQTNVGTYTSRPGAIRQLWGDQGFERGPIGYPRSDEECYNGYCRQFFEGGYIHWTAAAGVHAVYNGPSVLVVNKQRPLSPINYAPPSLIGVYGVPMAQEAGYAMQRLIGDARAAGIGMNAVSGYRDYATQSSLYNHYVSLYGQAQADLISARPGYSEHQTGLAADIGDSSGACALQQCFEGTAAGSWARNNAWRYGFIVRYPAGHTHITGYSYEPWHLRYVGTSIASDMRSRGIPTLEQYFGLPAAPSY